MVLALSIDPPTTAARTASQLGVQFPLLSDPSAALIRQYLMYSQRMRMADMGYVLIDAGGRVRYRVRDPQFGAHSPAILQKFARMQTAQ